MRIENGKVYASRKVARFWRPILQPVVNFIGGFLEISIPNWPIALALIIAGSIIATYGVHA